MNPEWTSIGTDMALYLGIVIAFYTIVEWKESGEFNFKAYVIGLLTNVPFFSLVYLVMVRPGVEGLLTLVPTSLVVTVTSVLGSLPFFAYALPFVILSVYEGFSLYVDSSSSMPSWLYFGNLFGTVILTGAWLKPRLEWFEFMGVGFALTIVLGLIVWFGITLASAGITMSILGIEPAEERQKKREGEYGDEHIVGDILE